MEARTKERKKDVQNMSSRIYFTQLYAGIYNIPPIKLHLFLPFFIDKKSMELPYRVILYEIYHQQVTYNFSSSVNKKYTGKVSSIFDIWSPPKVLFLDTYPPLLFISLWLFVSPSEPDASFTFLVCEPLLIPLDGSIL